MPSHPEVRRARLPEPYGLPKDSPTLSWESVEARFKAALHYWISTADTEGTPLARPIDAVWLDGALYFGGHEDARWQRNLRANPRACVTLEDAENVVILEGVVEHFVPEEAFALSMGDAANEKVRVRRQRGRALSGRGLPLSAAGRPRLDPALQGRDPVPLRVLTRAG